MRLTSTDTKFSPGSVKIIKAYRLRLGRHIDYFSSFSKAQQFCYDKLDYCEAIGFEESAFVINKHGIIVGAIREIEIK